LLPTLVVTLMTLVVDRSEVHAANGGYPPRVSILNNCVGEESPPKDEGSSNSTLSSAVRPRAKRYGERWQTAVAVFLAFHDMSLAPSRSAAEALRAAAPWAFHSLYCVLLN